MFATLAEDRLFLFGEAASLLPFQLSDRVVGFAFPLIAEALVEHQGQNIVFVVLARRFAAQDICGAPKVSFELLECKFHRAPITVRSIMLTRVIVRFLVPDAELNLELLGSRSHSSTANTGTTG